MWEVIRNKLKDFSHFEIPGILLNVKCSHSSSRIIMGIIVKYVNILRELLNKIMA